MQGDYVHFFAYRYYNTFKPISNAGILLFT
jgi:hypothetical protein